MSLCEGAVALTDMRTTTLGQSLKFVATSILVAACSGRLNVLTSEDGGSDNSDGNSGTGNGNSGGRGGASTTGGTGGDQGTGTGGFGAGGSSSTGAGGFGAGGSTTGTGGSGAGGSTTGTGGFGGGGSSNTGGGPATGGSGGTGAGGAGTGGTIVIDGGQVDSGGTACIGVPYEVKIAPADLYVIADSSASMDCELGPAGKGCTRPNKDGGSGGNTRWDALNNAVTRVVTALQAKGTSAGILFAPRVDQAGSLLCQQGNYLKPSIAITNTPDAILKAFATQPRVGESLLSIPMAGAIDYVGPFAATTNGRSVGLAVVVDGSDPNSCEADWSLGAQIASKLAISTPPIRTTAIGLGLELTNLDRVAEAGGTNRARLIDTTVPADVVLTNLAQELIGAAMPCSFLIPALPDYKPPMLNIRLYFGTTSNWVMQYAVTNRASCNERGGWYFEEGIDPTRVSLCPATCETLSHDPDSRISYITGCPPISLPPP